MVLDILVDCISSRLLGLKTVRSEVVSGVLAHKRDLSDEFVDELRSDDIEGTLSDFVQMVFLAIGAVLFPAAQVEEQEIGVAAEDGLGRDAYDAIVNEELPNHPLFAGIHILLGTAVVHVALVGYCLILH